VKVPDRDPVVVVASTERLSGPDPALTVIDDPCDQIMSPQWMAPLLGAQTAGTHGHGLEIPMTLWSATRATGMSFGSLASIPMGARHGLEPKPNLRVSGHAETTTTAGIDIRAFESEEFLLTGKVRQLDTSLLMGAAQRSTWNPRLLLLQPRRALQNSSCPVVEQASGLQISNDRPTGWAGVLPTTHYPLPTLRWLGGGAEMSFPFPGRSIRWSFAHGHLEDIWGKGNQIE
jgi:hypothetical protein